MISSLKNALGPGFIMAGAAIGVSHLVQSTRAGAEFGTSLIGLVLLACLFKYPFLEFGARYAAATGESMIDGFGRLGKWAVWLFALITVSTMFVILASVSLVTAGLAGVVFGLSVSPVWLALGVLLASVGVLVLGQYRGLDITMRLIIIILMVSTIIAVVLALAQVADVSTLNPSAHWARIWTAGGFAFVLALLGWMPIPLDVAVWQSLWTLERSKQSRAPATVTASVFDFKLGYLTATLSAVVFVLLGAAIFGGTGQALPSSAVAFSDALITAYTDSLGSWAYGLMALAALSAMFSTTLAVSDAYPRVLFGLWQCLKPSTNATGERRESAEQTQSRYATILVVNALGALIVIAFFGAQFTRLIDFATTVSFLSAPLLGWLSLRLITQPWVAREHQPSGPLKALAISGLIFLMAFSVAWLFWRLA